MRFRAILFDIDGTLVDSNDLHVKAWLEAFAKFDQELSASSVHAQIGKGTDMLVPALMPEADEPTRKAIGDAHGEIFKSKYLKCVKPFPAARDLLHQVHEAGQRVVLASSASKEELDHYVDMLDVRKLISACTTADDVENTKPAPDIFAVALKKVAPLSAQEALVIGDSPFDVEAAHKLGIDVIAVRSGKFSKDVFRDARPIAIYEDVAALCRDYKTSPLSKS